MCGTCDVWYMFITNMCSCAPNEFAMLKCIFCRNENLPDHARKAGEKTLKVSVSVNCVCVYVCTYSHVYVCALVYVCILYCTFTVHTYM